MGVAVEYGSYAELVGGSLGEPADVLDGVLENPNDGTFLGSQRATAGDRLELALEAAEAAWRDGSWSGIGIEQRASALGRFADELDARAEEIGAVDSIDSGLPLSTSRLVAGSLGDSVRGAVAELTAADERTTLEAGGRRVEVLRLPWGPALLLTPWNAPAAAAISKLANALAAGCPVILKPSEFAPSFARFFAEAALAAELPPGAVQIVHGDAGVARRLAADPRVRALALTGSQAAGRSVAELAAPRMVALQLELGGTNPAVVCADADPAATAAALAAGMTKLNGQWCEAPRRALVAAAVHDELVAALEQELAQLTVGPTDAEATAVGPLAHRGHLARVEAQVAGLGGERRAPAPIPGNDGFFFSPALVLGVEPDATGEEIFGPVLSIHRVVDEAEAIRLANAHGDGLAGYVFSGDEERAFALGRALHAGEVRLGGTNLLDLAAGSTQSFWGSSGLGSHGSREVLEAFRGSRIVGQDDPSLPL